MKGCFLLHSKFAPIGHEIAKCLQSLGVRDFCAYTFPRTAYDFLCTQHDIRYSTIVYNNDIQTKYKDEAIDYDYLKKLEQEYGLPNLWPYLYIDRIVMNGQHIREYPYNYPTLSHEDMMRVLQVTAKEIIVFLKQEAPDFLVMSVIGSVGTMLLYHVARTMGIKIFIIDATRIHNGIAVTQNFRYFTDAQRIFEELQKNTRSSIKEKEAREFLEQFRQKPAPYASDYTPSQRPIARLQQLAFLSPKKILKSIRWTLLSFIRYAKKEQKDYTDEIPYWALWDRLKRKMRGLYGYNDLYKKPVDESFAFFALHMEPETATMLYAPHYTNQQELIRQAARALPVGMKLYVKEHPFMVTYRPRRYYKEILKIPNVKLIDPAISAYDLIRQAKLIITATGTSAWEGVLLRKPAITFGDVFYNALSMVKRCRSFEELPYLVKEQLENFHYDETKEKELIDFIATLLEDSVDFDLISLWEHEDQGENIKRDEGLRHLAENIAKKLGLTSAKKQ